MILYKHLARDLNRARCIPGKHKGILGIDQLDKVIDIDQSPIDLARHIDVGQEMHLNLYDAVTAARLTASALYIKTEPSLLIASRFRIRRARKQRAQRKII